MTDRDRETKASEQMCDWDEKRYKCKVHPTCEATRKHVRVLLDENERLRGEVEILKEDRVKVVAVQRETIVDQQARIEAALAPHEPYRCTRMGVLDDFCSTCENEFWPCPTYKALKGEGE